MSAGFDRIAVFDPKGGQEQPATSERDSRWLPDSFWDERAVLGRIRRAARSRLVSADALLHAVLARAAAGANYTVQLPPTIATVSPLCYYAVLLGMPGGGKSGTVALAREFLPLLPNVADGLPVGTGEGLAEAFFENQPDPVSRGKTVRVQSRHNAFFAADEGSVLKALRSRQGATLLETLRTAWSGHALGQTNASAERRRFVPAGSYTLGLVLALQEGLADDLLADVNAGTPQRFAWAMATDPTLPDAPDRWPGRQDWSGPTRDQLDAIADDASSDGTSRHTLLVAESIQGEIRKAHLERNRGHVQSDPWQSHAELLRLRVAALLALLERRVEITEDDWRLAGVVKATSDATRDHARSVVASEGSRREIEATTRQANRVVASEAAKMVWRTTACAKLIHRKVITRGECGVGDLYRDMRRWRDDFEGGLSHALDHGWVIEESEPGQGTNKRLLRPGPNQPA